jgi:hypothetical protein
MGTPPGDECSSGGEQRSKELCGAGASPANYVNGHMRGELCSPRAIAVPALVALAWGKRVEAKTHVYFPTLPQRMREGCGKIKVKGSFASRSAGALVTLYDPCSTP